MSYDPTDTLTNCPYCVIEVPRLPVYLRHQTVIPSFYFQSIIMTAFFNQNRILYIRKGNSHKNNSSAVMIWKVYALASFASTHTEEYSSCLWKMFEVLYVSLVVSLLKNKFLLFKIVLFENSWVHVESYISKYSEIRAHHDHSVRNALYYL